MNISHQIDACAHRRRLIACFVFAAIAWTVQAPEARGQAGDFVDGAIWSFTMVPKGGGKKTLKGQYRIYHHVVYQKEKRADQKLNKAVGRNFPKKTKTRLVFTDFRAADRSGTWHEGMKGTAHLSMNKVGKWSGMMTDDKGRNWEFTCNRVKE